MTALLRILLFCLFLPLLMLASVTAARAAAPPELQVEGVTGEVLINVVEALPFPGGLQHDGGVSSLWLKRYLRQVPERVRLALEPYGYYTPQVEVSVEHDADPLRVRVVIDPGPPVRVSSYRVEVIGSEHPELQERIARFPLPKGTVLQHARYDAFKSTLLATAVDLGFLDATFSRHQIRVDRQAHSADIELVLATGPRYRFGAFRFSGGDNYPERFLRRYLLTRSGDIFSFTELGRSQQAFLDSDRFSSVVMVPLRDESEQDVIPVEIRLEEKAAKRLRPGIGYGTDTGARGFLRYQDVNVGHLGHEFSTDLLVAERQRNLTANYLFPGYRNLDTLFALHGGYKSEDLETYETRYLFVEGEQIYGFTERRVGSFFVRFQRETSTFSGAKVTSRVLMPGVRFRMGRIDDPIRPQDGYYLSLEARGSRAGILSDVSLVQLLGDVKWILPLPWRLSLQLRGNAGISLQQNALDEVPASLRFFAGGDQSVRGYAYQSLGPTNALGEVVGGKHLLVGSVELEKRVFENWGAALFFDAGNAFNDLRDYNLAEAAGAGLRYFTPIGPVRVDVARTLNTEKVNYRLHIGLGFGW